ncbi:MAG TPA: iron-sulfur cluster repair di-iron protein [Myxococcota bacterium]|nr:iron-sulfur cluster repair di-iron protein [Myxococcota bacterium]HRY94609.1 iron-sulfur cluster repair di-iron protein [Myxococcota bacterium]HSA20235.1 iron-sulfur cluster repair di-iron protein [Myxococcota bacterium]
MNPIDQTLAQLVISNPLAAEVLARRGLDFCCRGSRTLGEACQGAGLEAGDLLAELAAAGADRPAGESWAVRPLDELVAHILERYHAPLRQDLPGLVALAETVERVHADKPSCPTGLAAHLARVQAAVEDHLAKEERILFPLILAGRAETAHMPIKVMQEEHEDHGQNLRRTRALTRGLAPPPEACASWRALYRGLASLEHELMVHIHLENAILFPRALAG